MAPSLQRIENYSRCLESSVLLVNVNPLIHTSSRKDTDDVADQGLMLHGYLYFAAFYPFTF